MLFNKSFLYTHAIHIKTKKPIKFILLFYYRKKETKKKKETQRKD